MFFLFFLEFEIWGLEFGAFYYYYDITDRLIKGNNFYCTKRQTNIYLLFKFKAMKTIKKYFLVTLIFLSLIIISNLAFSQVESKESELSVAFATDIFEFIKFEEKENSKIVYFTIQGITDEVHKKSISNKMLSDENIINFKISENNKCEVTVNNNVSADYIRKILLSEGFDYNYKTVKINNKESKNSDIRKKSPEHLFKK